MSELKEIAIAIARIVLGMVVLIEGLTLGIFISYISTIGGVYDKAVEAAYEDSYGSGYAQTYDVVYQEAYGEVYDKGYDKGYEIGLETGSNEGVATRVELSDPTHKEMREFLARDKTDSKPYIKGEYGCNDFAAQLDNNAEADGIRAAYVRIRSKNWWHAVVAFETVDRGIIFIEPQSDRVVKLVIGEPFPWHLVDKANPLGHLDPIVDIQIIW
ncbi:hypothetical protein ES703_93634 [subsurface metagenome]